MAADVSNDMNSDLHFDEAIKRDSNGTNPGLHFDEAIKRDSIGEQRAKYLQKFEDQEDVCPNCWSSRQRFRFTDEQLDRFTDAQPDGFEIHRRPARRSHR